MVRAASAARQIGRAEEMFYFTTGSGATCFVGFIGVIWLLMVVGAIVRAVRRKGSNGTMSDDDQICPDTKCLSHNAPYARFCRRCGASLDQDIRRIKQALNEDSR